MHGQSCTGKTCSKKQTPQAGLRGVVVSHSGQPELDLPDGGEQVMASAHHLGLGNEGNVPLAKEMPQLLCLSRSRFAHHDDRHLLAQWVILDLPDEFRTAHSWHVEVGDDETELDMAL